MAQNKAGCSTLESMFGEKKEWQDIFQGKKIKNPKKYLSAYLDNSFTLTYKTTLLIRNPVDWIISGFRWMALENQMHKELPQYAKSLTEHLLAIQNKTPYDQHWLNHCLYFPMDFYNDGFRLFKLEEFNKFLKYLDRNCSSDYTKLETYNQNKNCVIPYPEITDVDKKLILELTSKRLESSYYNVEQTIELYQYKYKKGLLQ
jgi:hypothetical protein